MDFFDREAQARKRTRLLVCLFGLTVLAFVMFTYLVLAVVIQLFLRPVLQAGPFNYLNDFPVSPIHDGFIHPLNILERLWDPHLFFLITPITLILIAAGCLYKIRLLAGGGPAVAELLGGRKIDDQPAEIGR